MRIKIIGDNNCARATRHLLRKAGFAVTEFLPADVVTQAPHSGYVITIDCFSQAPSGARTQLAPAPHPLHGEHRDPTSKPDHSTPAYAEAMAGRHTANHGEASPSHGGASSPTFLGQIDFDSVDSELESAILRHVTQLAATPVVVDRPGGVVHSERELRIVVSNSGDAKADEAAAVAVEFGVLRGLLDLVSYASPGKGAVAPSGPRGRNAKKWWSFRAVIIAGTVLAFAGRLPASPRHVVEARGLNGAYLHLETTLAPEPAQGQFATGQAPVRITDGTNSLVVDPCKAQTKLYASINQTANTQLVTGTASKKIYICSIHVVVAVATNAALVEGTGSVCATGTAGVSGLGGATAATGWNFAANGGIVLGNGDAAVGAEGTNADNLCLFNSGSGQVSGGISYVVQ